MTTKELEQKVKDLEKQIALLEEIKSLEKRLNELNKQKTIIYPYTDTTQIYPYLHPWTCDNTKPTYC